MNFNNPYNAYNPYANMYQPQQQPIQQNQYAFVNGIEGAKSYLMQPNQTVLLMDSDAPMCYMKTSNQLGQSTLRYFKLTEVTETSSKPNVEYALKSDLDALKEKLDLLLNKKEG